MALVFCWFNMETLNVLLVPRMHKKPAFTEFDFVYGEEYSLIWSKIQINDDNITCSKKNIEG